MAQDLTVALRITADGRVATAEIQRTGQAIQALVPQAQQVARETTAAAEQSGRAFLGLRTNAEGAASAFAGLSTRVAALGPALLALGAGAGAVAGIRAIARAGDEATQSVARLRAAFGGTADSNAIFARIQADAQRTGVAINESVAATTRFAVAARELGATSADVSRLVEGIQRFGIVSGTSAAEASAAVQQLGQALASGTFQGDELRSVLENMPNLAVALARELGVSVGQLRDMGAQGQLTADRVFPALLRASQGINEDFERMPQSISRAYAQLAASMDTFLAKLDSALGISRNIVLALNGARIVVDAVSRGGTAAAAAAGTAATLAANDRADQDALRIRRPGEPVGPAGLAADRAAAAAAAERAVRDATIAASRSRFEEAQEDREVAESERAAARAAAAAGSRARATTALAPVVSDLDPVARIRRDAAERRRAIEAAYAAGAIDPRTTFDRQGRRLPGTRLTEAGARELQAEVDREEREAIRRERAGGGGGGGGDRLTPRERDGREIERRSREEAALTRDRDKARQSYDQLRASMDPVARAQVELERGQRTLRDAFEEGVIGQQEMEAQLGRLQDRFRDNSAAALRTSDAIGQEFTAAAKDAAKALTDMLLGLTSFQDGLGKLLNTLASGIMQRLIQDQITIPIADALAQLARAGLGSLGLGGSAPIAANSNVAGGNFALGGLYHTGGIVGAGGVSRLVDARLFASAPRYHSGGLAGDEVPAILKRGEGVFTPEQMAAMGGGGTTVQIIDQRSGGQPASVEQSQGPNGERLLRVLIRDETNRALADGGMDKVMEGAFGVRRRGR